MADPELVFAAALKANAVSIIISHNHPSSNFTLGTAGQYITQKIKSVASIGYYVVRSP
ncbi:JAB domain-containing protein [Niabella ginsenosidivorans]|uniref:JAB domain-containing protein n=1 Tax=Niabella ginsenosidivorans TaxID=1176587 RepID=UPI000A0719A0